MKNYIIKSGSLIIILFIIIDVYVILDSNFFWKEAMALGSLLGFMFLLSALILNYIKAHRKNM